MREIPKVALLIETARGFGRDFLLGIARYSRLHGPWSFHITQHPRRKRWSKMQSRPGKNTINVEPVP